MEFFIPMVAMVDLAAVAVAMQVLAAVAVILVAAAVAGPTQDGAAAVVPIILAQI